MDANERKALRERAKAAWPTERDTFERAAAYEDDVLALLDALEAAEDETLRVRTRAAEEAMEREAERDELAAEIAAYRGRPEGALPEWRRADGYYVRHLPAEVVLTAYGCVWAVRQGAGRSRLVAEGKAPTPIGAQRAAEAAARARGLL